MSKSNNKYTNVFIDDKNKIIEFLESVSPKMVDYIRERERERE